MPDQHLTIDGKPYTIHSERPLSDAELVQYAGKVRSLYGQPSPSVAPAGGYNLQGDIDKLKGTPQDQRATPTPKAAKPAPYNMPANLKEFGIAGADVTAAKNADEQQRQFSGMIDRDVKTGNQRQKQESDYEAHMQQAHDAYVKRVTARVGKGLSPEAKKKRDAAVAQRNQLLQAKQYAEQHPEGNPNFDPGVPITAPPVFKTPRNPAEAGHAATVADVGGSIGAVPGELIHQASNSLSQSQNGEPVDPSVYENDLASRISNHVGEFAPYMIPGVNAILGAGQALQIGGMIGQDPKKGIATLWHSVNPTEEGLAPEERVLRAIGLGLAVAGGAHGVLKMRDALTTGYNVPPKIADEIIHASDETSHGKPVQLGEEAKKSLAEIAQETARQQGFPEHLVKNVTGLDARGKPIVRVKAGAIEHTAVSETPPPAGGVEKPPVAPTIKENLTVAPNGGGGTSVKNASTNADRLAMGLDKLPEHERVTFEQSLASARESGKNTPTKALGAADRILGGKQDHLSPEESAGIVDYMVTLKNDHRGAMEEVNRLIDDGGSKHEIDSLRDHVADIEDQFEKLTDATKKAGTKSAQALVARKLTLNKDYDLISVLNRAKAKKGAALSDVERAKFTKQVEELQNEIAGHKASNQAIEAKHSRLQQDFDALQERTKAQETRAHAGRDQANQRQLRSKSSRERISTNRQAAVADLHAALDNWGKGGPKGKMPRNAGAIQFPEELPEAVDAVGRIARSYIEEGAQSVQDVYEGVKEHVKAKGFDISDKQIRKAYDRFLSKVNSKPVTDAMRTKVRISALLRIHSRIDQIIDQEVRAKGDSAVADLANHPEFQALRKQLNEVTKAYGDPAVKGDPAELKFAQQLQNALTTLERLKQGKSEPIPEKEGPLTPKASDLRTKLKGLQSEIKILREAQKTTKVRERLSEREIEARRLQRQIVELEAGPQPTKPEVVGPEHPQITRLKSERDALREKIADGKKTPETEKRLAQLQREIDRIGKTTEPKPKPLGPDHPDVINLTKERDALRRTYADMKRAAKPDAPRLSDTEIKIRRLNKQIADLQAGKAKPAPIQGPEHPEVTKLKNELAAFREKLGNKPGTKSDADKINDLQGRIANAERQLEGQYRDVRKPKTQDSEAVATVRKDLRSARIDLRLDDRTAELEEKLRNSPSHLYEQSLRDASARKAKKEASRGTEAQVLARGHIDQLKQKIDDRIEQGRPKTFAEKLIKLQRAGVLSSPAIVMKLASASGWRLALGPMEDALGYGVERLPAGGGKTFGQVAPQVGGGASIARMRGTFSMEALRNSVDNITKGLDRIDALAGKQGHSENGFLSYPGRSHGAIKSFVKTGEFKSAMAKQMRLAVRDGLDIASPAVQDQIGLRAAAEAQNSILQGENGLTKGMNAYLDQAAKGNASQQAIAVVGRLFAPIARVAANYVGQSVDYTGAGLLRGGVMHAAGLMDAAKTGEPMPHDLVVNIGRAYKRGGLGLVAAYIGYTQPEWFTSTGYYTGPKSKNPDEMAMGGHRVLSLFSHSPFANAVQFWATVRHLMDDRKTPSDASATAGWGLLEQMPGVQEASRVVKAGSEGKAAEAAGDLLSGYNPGIVKAGARTFDQTGSQSGFGVFLHADPRKVDTSGFFGPIEEGIPGVRNRMPNKKSTSRGAGVRKLRI